MDFRLILFQKWILEACKTNTLPDEQAYRTGVEKKQELKSQDVADKKAASSNSQLISDFARCFNGKKILLLGELPHAADIRRYVVAYDGDVVDTFASDVTHVITNEPWSKVSK